jgi:hypothetical protein
LKNIFFAFEDNETSWKYGNSIKSSVTIRSKSLASNRTYQFMVYMESRQNSSLQATGYVLVRIEDASSTMIAIGYRNHFFPTK